MRLLYIASVVVLVLIVALFLLFGRGPTDDGGNTPEPESTSIEHTVPQEETSPGGDPAEELQERTSPLPEREGTLPSTGGLLG